jgi:TolA-binding protein
MKTFYIIILISLISITGTLAQIPEEGSFKYLQDAYSKRNSDVMDYLIQECLQFLEQFPSSPNADEVLFMLANLYEEEKEYAAAFVSYLQFKFIYPNSDRRNDALSNLNQIIHNKDESTFKDKRKQIDELISHSLSFADRNSATYEYLSFIYDLDIEDLNETLINQINAYMRGYTNNAKNIDQLYFWIADLHVKLSNEYKAIFTYSRIPFIAPQSILIPQALFQTGYLQYKETGEYQKAKDTFVSLIAAHPETPEAGEAQFYLAEVYETKLDNLDEAVANYRVLVETYPDNKYAVESLKRVAEIMDDKERYEESIASYHQIFELYPKNEYAPEALLEIESTYRRRLENYEKAIEILKLYSSQYPDREDAPERLFDAGEIYADDLNNKQAAIDTYTEVIKNFPNSDYAEKAKDSIEDLREE